MKTTKSNEINTNQTKVMKQVKFTIANRIAVTEVIRDSKLVAVTPKYSSTSMELKHIVLSYKVRGVLEPASTTIFPDKEELLCQIALVALQDRSKDTELYESNPCFFNSLREGGEYHSMLANILNRKCYIYTLDGKNNGVFIRTTRVEYAASSADGTTMRSEYIPYRYKTNENSWDDKDGLTINKHYAPRVRKVVRARVFEEWNTELCLDFLNNLYSFKPEGHELTNKVSLAKFRSDIELVRRYSKVTKYVTIDN